MSERLAIIMPTYRRPAILARSLAALVRAVEGLDAVIDAEIVVVNDDAQPLSAELIPPGVRVLQNRGKGPSAARNFGVAATSGSVLLFVDDDIVLERSHLDHLLDLHRQKPSSVFNVNWTYPPDLIARLETSPFGRYLIAAGRTTMRGWNHASPEWDEPKLRPVKSVGSYCLLMSRATYDLIGGYSEAMPISGDDAYLSHRLAEAGVAAWVTTHICVWHNEADRADLTDYLDRQTRGAHGIGRAVRAQVYPAPAPKPLLKRILTAVGTPADPLLRQLARDWPNWPTLDALYRRLINLLYLVAFDRGYRRGLAEPLPTP